MRKVRVAEGIVGAFEDKRLTFQRHVPPTNLLSILPFVNGTTPMKTSKRIIIVGGVAGGASCAARCRRLDENATIIVIDRGPYVSFANCGLPYYVGDVIKDEGKLLVANAPLFRERFNIEVRTQNEVTASTAPVARLR